MKLDQNFEQLVDNCERCDQPNYAKYYNENNGRAQYRCRYCNTGWTCYWSYTMQSLLEQ